MNAWEIVLEHEKDGLWYHDTTPEGAEDRGTKWCMFGSLHLLLCVGDCGVYVPDPDDCMVVL